MVKITGVQTVLGNLREAGQIPKGRILDGMIKEALEPMRNAINARAPRRILKGTARSALHEGRSPSRRIWWIAFVEPGRRVAHLIELGTAPHSLAKGASRRKNIMQDVPPHHPGDPPDPFMRPAFEETGEEVVRALGRSFMQHMNTRFGRR